MVRIGERNSVDMTLTLFFREITSKWSRPDDGWTTTTANLDTLGRLCCSAIIDAEISGDVSFRTADELGGLIELGDHI